MKKITGKIEKISRTDKETKFGKKTRLGIKLDNGEWYNGFESNAWDAVEEGDQVLLEVETKTSNGKTYHNLKSLSNLKDTHTSAETPIENKIQDSKTKYWEDKAKSDKLKEEQILWCWAFGKAYEKYDTVTDWSSIINDAEKLQAEVKKRTGVKE